MKDLKLTIDLLPKGAWNNDFSKTLPKKDWDILREACYKKANGKCQICGAKTNDLDAHEVWEFDIKNKTQTLKDIIGICTKCHGVKHFKNSARLGLAELAKQHFIEVNNVSEMDFANHLTKTVMDYEQLNKIYRWNIIADLSKFGGNGIEVKQKVMPLIKNPYENVNWTVATFEEKKNLFESILANPQPYWSTPPKVISILVDNYLGEIQIICNDVNKIEWYLDGVKIRTKYNVIGKFTTSFKVVNLQGKYLNFKLIGNGGETISKVFELLSQEVI